jgi:hypothetical protein
MLWLSWVHPVIALCALAALVVASLVIVWVLWQFLARLLHRMRSGQIVHALE